VHRPVVVHPDIHALKRETRFQIGDLLHGIVERRRHEALARIPPGFFSSSRMSFSAAYGPAFSSPRLTPFSSSGFPIGSGIEMPIDRAICSTSG
jgi:hypothetical protein